MYFLHCQDTCKFLEQEFYSTALFCGSTGKMDFFSRQSISKTSERPTKLVSVLRDKVCLFRVFNPGSLLFHWCKRSDGTRCWFQRSLYVSLPNTLVDAGPYLMLLCDSLQVVNEQVLVLWQQGEHHSQPI